MIRIAKLPYIIEDSDRWGRPLGTFSVIDIQGDLDEETWAKVKEFESYHISDGAKEDTKIMKECLDNVISGTVVLDVNNMPKLPYMTKLIGYCNSQIYQFNLRTKNSTENDFDYIRSYGIFGEITNYEWTPEHDEKVKDLQKQVDQMNKSK